MRKPISILILTVFCILQCLSASAQGSKKLTVSGKVVDESGAPLPAITVFEDGKTTNGVLTGMDGVYKITVPSDATVVFSSLGFTEIKEKVAGRASINVTMKEESLSLDAAEVVEVGYGSVAKRDLTGSVSKVDMDELKKAPIVNFDQAIQGRVAGVVVTTSDGEIGSGASITIRGNNSLTQSNEPLYVIDGFPSESSYATSIAPSDIESIDVLKDASATAIYGARGANGVIVITTKNGTEGKPVVNFTASVTTNEITSRVELLDGYEFALLQQDIYLGRGTSCPYTDGRDAETGQNIRDFYSIEDYKGMASIDWQDQVYRRSWTQNYSVSLSGGSKAGGTRYNASFSALDMDGIIVNSNFQRYQGKFSIIQKIGKKMTLDARVNYSHTGKVGVSPTDASSTGTSSSYLLYSVWGYRPTTPLKYGKTSEDLINSLIDEDNGVVIDSRFNPAKSVREEYRNRIVDLIQANGSLTYEILPSLKLKISGGYTTNTQRTEEFNNTNTSTGSPLSTSGRGVNGAIYWGSRNSWLNENTLTWTKSINRKHRINLLGGITFQGDKYNYQGVKSYHMTTEALGLNGLNTGDYQTVTPYQRDWHLMSYLARLTYSYNYKYYLTASFRADGSSKFPTANRWGYFPSASFAWNFNREDALKNLSWLSNGKFRASWGKTGNNRTSTPYDYYAIITTSPGSTTTYDYVSDGKIVAGYYPSNMENAKLKWETTSQTDLGLDLGLFDNRIKLTADVYQKTTRDLLLAATLPGSSGYTSAMINIGSLRNRGLELTLDLVPVKTRNFEWDFNFNIGFNRNKVLALANNQDVLMSQCSFDGQYNTQYAYTTQIGKPAGLMYGYIYLGTYKADDFDGTGLKRGVEYMEELGREGTHEGYPHYKDINGDGIVNDYDRTVIGSGQPIHTGGFSNSFRYKGFDLGVFFSWSYGNDILNANRLVFENGYRYNLNQFKSVANRYNKFTNPTSDIPCAYAGGIENFSSRVIEDGSYLRLKSVSLGYNLPKKATTALHIGDCRIYVSGENLWTLTNYSGNDPEVSTRNSVLTPGFDWAAYPRAFGLTAGINLKF